MRDIFQKIYDSNHWKNDESVSGHGSSLAATEHIRSVLPSLFKELKIESILDIPCGDFWWLAHVEEMQNFKYIGADIVPDLIRQNRQRYMHPNWAFQVMDVTKDRLPQVDLILCRDLLGHLSNASVSQALANIKSSGAKYLLATTFPGRETSGDIRDGEWRPIDLGYMWGLPNLSVIINEQCTASNGKYADKSLGLWRIN